MADRTSIEEASAEEVAGELDLQGRTLLASKPLRWSLNVSVTNYLFPPKYPISRSD